MTRTKYGDWVVDGREAREFTRFEMGGGGFLRVAGDG